MYPQLAIPPELEALLRLRGSNRPTLSPERDAELTEMIGTDPQTEAMRTLIGKLTAGQAAGATAVAADPNASSMMGGAEWHGLVDNAPPSMQARLSQLPIMGGNLPRGMYTPEARAAIDERQYDPKQSGITGPYGPTVTGRLPYEYTQADRWAKEQAAEQLAAEQMEKNRIKVVGSNSPSEPTSTGDRISDLKKEGFTVVEGSKRTKEQQAKLDENKKDYAVRQEAEANRVQAFRDRIMAQREAERLRKQGVDPIRAEIMARMNLGGGAAAASPDDLAMMGEPGANILAARGADARAKESQARAKFDAARTDALGSAIDRKLEEPADASPFVPKSVTPPATAKETPKARPLTTTDRDTTILKIKERASKGDVDSALDAIPENIDDVDQLGDLRTYIVDGVGGKKYQEWLDEQRKSAKGLDTKPKQAEIKKIVARLRMLGEHDVADEVEREWEANKMDVKKAAGEAYRGGAYNHP